MVGKNILSHPSKKNYNFFTPTRDELDLSKKLDVYNYIKKLNPDLIIHCAGTVGGIALNMSQPIKFLVDNALIGLHVISSASKLGIPKLINLGSSCMYPKNIPNPINENKLLSGLLEPTNEGYALAKILTERLCKYVNIENSKLSYKTIIPCNLYGLYDNFDLHKSHLIPAIINKIHFAKNNNKKVQIWGDGSAKREFMFAADLADFIFYSMDSNYNINETINVGLGVDYTVLEYYEKIAEIMNYDKGFDFDKNKPVGMKQKLVDISKLNKTGWKAKHSLEEGLKKTIDYFYGEIV